MVRIWISISPEFIPSYLGDITMYEGDNAPWNDHGVWNVIKKQRFRHKDTGIVISMIKYEHSAHVFYLKLLTSSGLVGWVYDHNFALC